MSDNADFMTSIMKIPYFCQLADVNGVQWLSDVFRDLEVSTFDFSQFQDLIQEPHGDMQQDEHAADFVSLQPDVQAGVFADIHDAIAIEGKDRVDVSHEHLTAGDSTQDRELHGGHHTGLSIDRAAADEIHTHTVEHDDDEAPDNFDFVGDFSVTEDKFDFSGLLSGDQFVFKGTAAFDGGGSAEVRYVKNASDTVVQVDINGDGTTDMQIKLDHAMDLTSGNFVL